MAKQNEKPHNLDDYIKSLGKELRNAKAAFWKETRMAEDAFHKSMHNAMADYEKVEYSKKRVPGAIAEAGQVFDQEYDSAYKIFGGETRAALERFKKRIEDLISP